MEQTKATLTACYEVTNSHLKLILTTPRI